MIENNGANEENTFNEGSREYTFSNEKSKISDEEKHRSYIKGKASVVLKRVWLYVAEKKASDWDKTKDDILKQLPKYLSSSMSQAEKDEVIDSARGLMKKLNSPFDFLVRYWTDHQQKKLSKNMTDIMRLQLNQIDNAPNSMRDDGTRRV